MVNRITVTLEQAEYSALLTLAIKELRGPADHLRHILRVELQNHGLWPPIDQQSEQEAQHDSKD